MIKTLKKLTIVYGHYGSGKTNFSINLALDFAKKAKTVLIDLDIVNPYFRSSDYKNLLADKGIDVIAPNFAGTTLDLPSLPPQIGTVLENDDKYVIVDVGGDDAGAFALGRFSASINNREDKEILYLVNKYRVQTAKPQEAVEILREIEKASRVKATAIINNSHLQQFTDEDTVLRSTEYAEDVSRLVKLPVLATTAPKEIAKTLEEKVKNIYPVDIIVKPPFE